MTTAGASAADGLALLEAALPSAAHVRRLAGARDGFAPRLVSRARSGLHEPLTKPVRVPLIVDEGAALDPPCKSTPFPPTTYLTTHPPRCVWSGWSSRPWGRLSICRGDPGPQGADGVSKGSETGWGRAKSKGKLQQDQAGNRASLGGAPGGRRVITGAIDQRFGWGGRGSREREDGPSAGVTRR